jgi:hypothetical protein
VPDDISITSAKSSRNATLAGFKLCKLERLTGHSHVVGVIGA